MKIKGLKKEERKNNSKSLWEIRLCSLNPHLADDGVFCARDVLSELVTADFKFPAGAPSQKQEMFAKRFLVSLLFEYLSRNLLIF